MTKVRGVFEHQPGVWWIQYFAEGKRHREKVGRKSDAIKLYQTRKSAIHAGIKLPTLRNHATLLSELIADVLKFVSEHKSVPSYHSRGKIVSDALGARVAESLTPQELDEWLRIHCQTPATANRYRAFLSLCYREGIANKKVKTNPARLVRRRREPRGRMRFLSRDEYDKLCVVIQGRFPLRLAEFVVSVHTGMRLSEQYRATWSQFHAGKRVIELCDTKNAEPRTVYLNQVAFDAIMSVKPKKADNGAPIFPHLDKSFDNGGWFDPCVQVAGVDNYTWHNNRHTFGSWLAMAGASIKEIQEAGGWKSIQMAARYMHLSPAHTSAVVDRLVG